MPSTYDPSAPAAAFDRFGDLEWERHEETPYARASFHIHRELLRSHVHTGDRVLERREQADVVDLGSFGDGTFDAVVCYGGPLSYVMERSGKAFAELLRVTRPDGHVLASVMSLDGAIRIFLPAMVEDLGRLGPMATDVLRTGDPPPEQSTTAPMHLFTWSDVEALIGRHPCELVASSAANFITTQHAELLDQLIDDDPETWSTILEWETAMSASSGVLGAGTHIIFVVRKRSG